MKTCTKCLQVKEDTCLLLIKRTGKLNSWCQDCVRAARDRYRVSKSGREAEKRYRAGTGKKKMKQYRRNWRARQGDRDQSHGWAQKMAYAAFKLGIIKEQACSDCGTNNWPKEMHHTDYSKPLDITWLCRECHKRRHGKYSQEWKT